MKTFFVLIVLALGVFIYLKVQIGGDPSSSFNQTTRYKLGQYAPVRSVLGLHNAGDAQRWYLDGKNEMSLEVVEANGTNLDDKALNDFAKEIQDYLGRNVVVYDTETISGGTLTDDDLATIAKGSRHHVILGEPNLFVIYAQDFSRTNQQQVAKTFQESAIVLSDTALQALANGRTDALPQYQQAAMLHQFGYLLGLPTNNESNCVMNANMDNPQASFAFNGVFAPTQFCDFELKQLDDLKAAQ